MADQKNNKIKHFVFYFREMMKFYQLKNDFVTPIIFIVILALLFGARLWVMPLAQDIMEMTEGLIEQFRQNTLDTSIIFSETYMNMMQSALKIAFVFAAQQIVLFLLSILYMTFYFTELKDSSISVGQCFVIYLKRLPNILLMNLVYYLVLVLCFWFAAVIMAVIGMFIPLLLVLGYMGFAVAYIIITVMFIFKDILIIDGHSGVYSVLKNSFTMTKGNRGVIARNVLFLYILQYLLNFITIGINNQMSALFIISFSEVIIILIMQRLITLMYINVVYNLPKKEDEKQLME